MPSSVEALIILLLVVVPGFICALTFLGTVANIEASELRFLLTTITFGALVHIPFILVGWTTALLRIYRDDPARLLNNTHELALWGGLTIFVLPFGVGLGLALLVRLTPVDRFLTVFGLGYIDNLPSAWEYVFHKPKGSFVRIYLKNDGTVIGGRYSTDSFASDPPNPTDIYIEEEWLLDADGEFRQIRPTTRGVWISHDVVAYIQFLDGLPADGDQADGQAQHTTSSDSSATGNQGESTDNSGESQPPSASAEDRKEVK